jgi:hypothetical protein
MRPEAKIARCSRSGAGLQKRRQAVWISWEAWNTKDLVLEIWGARYSSTSKFRDQSELTLTSMGADLDRSRYVSVRSKSWLD